MSIYDSGVHLDPLPKESFLDGLSEFSSKEIGDIGEAIASAYLVERGYVVLERGFRCHEGEADIIAYDPDARSTVFVEVKTRRSASLDEGVYPEEAVDASKRRRYRRIAASFLASRGASAVVRFDVIGIILTSGSSACVEHVIGAFDWDLGL